jgi:hypothetical protein
MGCNSATTASGALLKCTRMAAFAAQAVDACLVVAARLTFVVAIPNVAPAACTTVRRGVRRSKGLCTRYVLRAGYDDFIRSA